MSRAFVALQHLLPQHALSRVLGWGAASELPWLKGAIISAFSAAYDVNLDEAIVPEGGFRSFNDFFTRPLKPGARPIDTDPSVAVSPADGAVSQAGTIEAGRLLQAKGHRYALEALAGAPVPEFEGGSFATVYLAPRDYHRVHLPLAGRLVETRSIPGALYSVNAATEAGVDGLFARNERLVCRFETEHGPMLLVLVGAMIVASIETVWGAPVSPYDIVGYDLFPRTDAYDFHRGAEIGRFLLGSTAIVCMAKPGSGPAPGIATGSTIRMGQPLLSV